MFHRSPELIGGNIHGIWIRHIITRKYFTDSFFYRSQQVGQPARKELPVRLRQHRSVRRLVRRHGRGAGGAGLGPRLQPKGGGGAHRIAVCGDIDLARILIGSLRHLDFLGLLLPEEPSAQQVNLDGKDQQK